jgi:excisionase family DNA binding protein
VNGALAPLVDDRQELQMERMTYTIVEAARLLGVGKTTLYEAVRLGEVPAIRVRGRMLIARPVLAELLGFEPPLPDALIASSRFESRS